MTEQVLKDFKLDDKSDKFEFFSCVGFEKFNFGCYPLRKVYIGLPFYFDYRKEKHINIDELTFYGDQAPNWNSDQGKSFIKNLVLSDEAKKYAIAESIHVGKSKENLLRCLSPLVASILSVLSYFKFNYLLNDSKKLTKSAKTSLSLFGSLCFCVIYFLLLKKLIDDYSRFVIDEFLRDLKDQNYIGGGFEYYYKKQKRNLAFRHFLGPEGHKDFRANGDFNVRFRRQYPISEMIVKISEKDEFGSAKK